MSDFIHVKRPDIEPAVWATPIPLAVIELCESNSHVMTWWALRWLMLVFPDRDGFGRREIGRRARVSESRTHLYLEYLREHGLVDVVGQAEIRNLHARPVYTIDLLKLERMSIELVIPVITSWGATPRPRRQPEQQTSFLFTPESASGLVGVQTSGLDGVQNDDLSGLNGVQKNDLSGLVGVQTSGLLRVHLMKGNERKGEDLTSLPSGHSASPQSEKLFALESVSVPAAEAPLPGHPLTMWAAACPTCDADDQLRLTAYAAEHDQPKGAYTGGYGWYWLGRAILATLNAGGRIHHQRLKGLLDHWRERTTDADNAYGANSPAYERKRSKRAAEHTASTPAEASQPSAELRDLWSAVLDQLAATIDATRFRTWLQPTALLDLGTEQAIVGTPNIFTREKLEQEFGDAIAEALHAVCGRRVAVVCVIDS